MSKVERLQRQWPEKLETLTAVTHLLITKYILKWQEYVVSVMLISVLNIKLTCE